MPQFAPKTHSAREHLIAVGARWPGLWAACDMVRLQFPQAPECYLSDAFGALAVVESVRAAGNPVDLEMLRGLDALSASRLLTPVTTMVCWRMAQGIYRIDPALYETLISTPLTGELPADVLLHLPEWCVYIETPELEVHRFDGRGKTPLRGCFARIDAEGCTPQTVRKTPPLPGESGPYNLVLGLDMPEAQNLECQSIPLRGNIDEALADAMAEWGNTDESVRAALRAYIEPIINLLLYICAVGDIRGKRGHPGNPEPVRTRRDGWRLFGADGPKTWDVGVRMGAALRAAYQREQTGGDAAPTGTHVRPHVRRAHWHGFRSGPRKDGAGQDISADKRKFELKWLPPIPVNIEDIDSLPSVVREVRR